MVLGLIHSSGPRKPHVGVLWLLDHRNRQRTLLSAQEPRSPLSPDAVEWVPSHAMASQVQATTGNTPVQLASTSRLAVTATVAKGARTPVS